MGVGGWAVVAALKEKLPREKRRKRTGGTSPIEGATAPQPPPCSVLVQGVLRRRDR